MVRVCEGVAAIRNATDVPRGLDRPVSWKRAADLACLVCMALGAVFLWLFGCGDRGAHDDVFGGCSNPQCVATLQDKVDDWSGWKGQHADRFRWVVRYDFDSGFYHCERPIMGGHLTKQSCYEMAFVTWCEELAYIAG